MSEDTVTIIATAILVAFVIFALVYNPRTLRAYSEHRRRVSRMTRTVGISRKSAKKQLRKIPNEERGEFRK